MNYTIEIDQEEDGRMIAEVIELPGVLAYGQTQAEAIAKVQVLALRVIADRIEHGEGSPVFVVISKTYLKEGASLAPLQSITFHAM